VAGVVFTATAVKGEEAKKEWWSMKERKREDAAVVALRRAFRVTYPFSFMIHF
jgi:hypothetical protein